jgi:pyruvate/2-oxoglutarate/acetoin dehydrogenase E1 component
MAEEFGMAAWEMGAEPIVACAGMRSAAGWSNVCFWMPSSSRLVSRPAALRFRFRLDATVTLALRQACAI